MTVVSLLRERVEIGQVVGNGDHDWMMNVIDEAEGPDAIDSGFYRSQEAAVAAALAWELPIIFVREVGSVTVEASA